MKKLFLLVTIATMLFAVLCISCQNNNTPIIDFPDANDDIYPETEVLWKYQTDSWVKSRPFVYNNKVYFGNHRNKLFCLDSDNGDLQWDYEPGLEAYGIITIVNGRMYAFCRDGNMHCIDPSNGNTLWTVTIGGTVHLPVVTDEYVYYSFEQDVFCISATNGELVWKRENVDIDIGTGLAEYDGFVFGQDDRNIICLNGETGEYVWAYAYDSCTFTNTPLALDGKIYVGCEDGFVYCLNATNGARIWGFNCDFSGKLRIAHDDNRLYVPGGNEITAYLIDSYAVYWKFNISEPNYKNNEVWSEIFVYQNHLYFTSSLGFLYCLDAQTGKLVWKFKGENKDKTVLSHPYVADDKVFVGTKEGYLYCLDAFGDGGS